MSREPTGDVRISRLPVPLQRWHYCERRLMHRGGDFLRVRPDTTDLDPQFLPEAPVPCFELPTYWIDESYVRCFRAGPVDSTVLRTFYSVRNGRNRLLFLVHPAAERLYRSFLGGCHAERARAGRGFWGAPTSSARTLFVWREGRERQAFFAKLSLPVSIGRVRRTITAECLTRSIGLTKILDSCRKSLPPNFKVLREPFGVMPDSCRDSGFIVRPVPREVVEGRFFYIPAFAFYARPRRRLPWLVSLINSSGLGACEFLAEHVLEPFAEQWVRLVVEEGLIPEPHAQNLLLEVDAHGRLTHTFVHRDLESFFVDLTHRARVGKPIPSDLPAVTSLRGNYSQFRLIRRAVNSTHRFFQGTILYELDRLLPEWSREGILRGPPSRPAEIETQFVRELEKALSRRTGSRVQLLRVDYRERLRSAILLARKAVIADGTRASMEASGGG